MSQKRRDRLRDKSISTASHDAAKAEATRLAEVEGLSYIAPFDDPAVVAGQATPAELTGALMARARKHERA
mgnify:CR=1 FL=1